MSNTVIVPGRAGWADREPPDRPPLVDAALADELLARAQFEGVGLLGPDGVVPEIENADRDTDAGGRRVESVPAHRA